MFRCKLFFIVTFCAISFLGVAQEAIVFKTPKAHSKIEQELPTKEKKISNPKHSFDFIKALSTQDYFNHLEIASSIGTTGFGFDLSTPITEYAQLRAGFSIMPRFEMTSRFRVQVGDSLDSKWDAQGNRVQTKFDKLSGYLKSFTGYEVDDEVEMLCKPTYYNLKVLLDLFPFRNKHWHFTFGFYAGPSEIARAYNKTEEMPSLLSVTIWNTLYDKAYNIEPIYDNIYMPSALENKLFSYGKMGFHAGDFIKDTNVNGKDYKAGDPYMMTPDETTGMVEAVIKVNRFKPYLGFGYGGAISKDKLTQLSFDAGVLFWGGTPSMITHDGTDLIKDVENVSGKVGRYVDIAKFFKVFPVIELRISRRIF